MKIFYAFVITLGLFLSTTRAAADECSYVWTCDSDGVCRYEWTCLPPEGTCAYEWTCDRSGVCSYVWTCN